MDNYALTFKDRLFTADFKKHACKRHVDIHIDRNVDQAWPEKQFQKEKKQKKTCLTTIAEFNFIPFEIKSVRYSKNAWTLIFSESAI